MSLTTKESKILYSILVASENDPRKPEFPPNDPKFPATPTYQIKVPGFSNVWLKDESVNLTGTHYDRMAWEIIVTYGDFLIAKKNGQVNEELPQMSIISGGTAALAIQTLLRKYKLPNLKCLIDENTDAKVLKSLKSIGCELYFANLFKKSFKFKDVLTITENLKGINLTSSDGLEPVTRFYDWMSYEIINQSPDYCFIPFGSGHLYQNIMNINKKEVQTENHDPRFYGNIKILRNCHFMGATISNPESKAKKLAIFNKIFDKYNEQWIRCYRLSGSCGQDSNVHLLQERFLDQAIELATKQDIACEPSGIAGLGLLLQMADKIPKNKKILIVNTGKTKYLSKSL